jgi:hypothetical protein
VCADSRPLSVQFVRYECVIPGAELVSFGRVDGVRPRLCETGGRAVRFSPESAVNFFWERSVCNVARVYIANVVPCEVGGCIAKARKVCVS